MLFSVCCCHSDLPGARLGWCVYAFLLVYMRVCVCVCVTEWQWHIWSACVRGVTVSRRWHQGVDRGWFAFLQVTLCCHPQNVHHLWRDSSEIKFSSLLFYPDKILCTITQTDGEVSRARGHHRLPRSTPGQCWYRPARPSQVWPLESPLPLLWLNLCREATHKYIKCTYRLPRG